MFEELFEGPIGLASAAAWPVHRSAGFSPMNWFPARIRLVASARNRSTGANDSATD